MHPNRNMMRPSPWQVDNPRNFRPRGAHNQGGFRPSRPFGFSGANPQRFRPPGNPLLQGPRPLLDNQYHQDNYQNERRERFNFQPRTGRFTNQFHQNDYQHNSEFPQRRYNNQFHEDDFDNDNFANNTPENIEIPARRSRYDNHYHQEDRRRERSKSSSKCNRINREDNKDHPNNSNRYIINHDKSGGHAETSTKSSHRNDWSSKYSFHANRRESHDNNAELNNVTSLFSRRSDFQDQLPSLDSSHRPPASDHYQNERVPSDGNTDAFKQTLHDTVDIVKKRMMHRRDPESDVSPSKNPSESHEDPSWSSSTQTSVSKKHKKKSHKERSKSKPLKDFSEKTDAQCANALKENIVEQLFKMDKSNLQKLVEDPRSSSKFEYAIHSLITESRNSYNKHLRSAAEKSLRNEVEIPENDTIYEDTFLKQMQCLLEPEDAVALTDIKPIIMAELNKVLQLDSLELQNENNYLKSFENQVFKTELSEQELQEKLEKQKSELRRLSAEIFESIEHADISVEGSSKQHPDDCNRDKFEKGHESNRKKHRRSHSSTQNSVTKTSQMKDLPQEDQEFYNEIFEGGEIDLPVNENLFDRKAYVRLNPHQSYENFTDDEDPFLNIAKKSPNRNLSFQLEAVADNSVAEQWQNNSIGSALEKLIKESDIIHGIKPEISLPDNALETNEISTAPQEDFDLINYVDERSNDTQNDSSRVDSQSEETTKQSSHKSKSEESSKRSNTKHKSKHEKVKASRSKESDKNSRRKEKYRKTDQKPLKKETNKKVLNKNIIINVNDCPNSKSDQADARPKSVFNLYFSKNDEASIHDKTSKKDKTSKMKGSKPQTGDKNSPIKTFDMFEQPTIKKEWHSPQKVIPPEITNDVTPPKKDVQILKNYKEKEASIFGRIKKRVAAGTQTITPKMFSRFSQTKTKTNLVSTSTQTDGFPQKNKSKTSDVFERMKEIDMEIQSLLQEKFKLYNNLENKEKHEMQDFGLTVVSVDQDELNPENTESIEIDKNTTEQETLPHVESVSKKKVKIPPVESVSHKKEKIPPVESVSNKREKTPTVDSVSNKKEKLHPAESAPNKKQKDKKKSAKELSKKKHNKQPKKQDVKDETKHFKCEKVTLTNLYNLYNLTKCSVNLTKVSDSFIASWKKNQNKNHQIDQLSTADEPSKIPHDQINKENDIKLEKSEREIGHCKTEVKSSDETDKLLSDETDKLPSGEKDKLLSDETEKLPSDKADKLLSDETKKLTSDETSKLLSDETNKPLSDETMKLPSKRTRKLSIDSEIQIKSEFKRTRKLSIDSRIRIKPESFKTDAVATEKERTLSSELKSEKKKNSHKDETEEWMPQETAEDERSTRSKRKRKVSEKTEQAEPKIYEKRQRKQTEKAAALEADKERICQPESKPTTRSRVKKDKQSTSTDVTKDEEQTDYVPGMSGIELQDDSEDVSTEIIVDGSFDIDRPLLLKNFEESSAKKVVREESSRVQSEPPTEASPSQDVQTLEQCKVYDFSTEEARCNTVSVSGHDDAIIAIEPIRDNFLAASLDGNVYYIHGHTGKILSVLRGSNLPVTCLNVVEDVFDATVYTGSLDSRIRYYNLETGMEKGLECNVLSPIQSMDRAWDTIFVGTKTGFVLQFECKNNYMLIPVSSVKFSEQSILALKAIREGPRKVLLVAARSESVTIKDAQTGLLLRTLEGPKMTVYSLLFEKGKVFCGTSIHQIYVFDYTSGTNVGVHNGGKGAICLKAAGGLLFAGCYDGCVYVYKHNEEQPIAILRGPTIMLLSLNIVDSKVVAGYKDRSLFIWSMPPNVLKEMVL